MRLLIDNALSPHIAQLLIGAGHDATHVRDRGLQAAADPVVFNAAAEEERVLVSADTDFGALLAVRRWAKPSFILLRRTKGLSAKALAMTIHDVVQRFEQELNSGCVITVTDDKIRIRSLPIG